MIAWETVDSGRFERGVQAVLRRLYPGLRSLDGAGGDGGRDAQLVTGDGTTIFEVKSFTTRISSAQRRQVERSLKRAIENAPDMGTWVLVVPLNMTPRRDGRTGSEEAWFEGRLADMAPGVRLDWWGQDWLDGQLADDPALLRYLEGVDAGLIARAREFQMEQAVMAAGCEDLARRNAVLRSRIDEVSLNWTLDWAVQGSTHIRTLREKYPGAADVDPIRLVPTFSFPVSDGAAEEVRERFELALEFGGSVDIPGRYIAEFKIEASAEARQLLGDHDRSQGTLSFVAPTERLDRPLPGTVSFVEDDDTSRGCIKVYFRERTSGRTGVTLTGGDPSGLVSVVMMLPYPGRENDPDAAPPRMTLEITDVAGFDLESVQAVLGVLAKVREGDRLRGTLGDFAVMLGRPIERDLPYPGAVDVLEVVNALQRLEAHTGRALRFPVGMSKAEAEMLKTAVRLLDGEQVATDDAEWVVPLRPDRVGEFLRLLPDEPRGFLVTHPHAELVAGDLRIPYGPLAQWAPRLRLRNREELVAHDGLGPVNAVLVTEDEPIYWVPRQLAEEYAAARELAG